jgi:hypothetical protein
MLALLDERPVAGRERLDLLRGALDAWLHPPTPSMVPIVSAFAGGGLWTVVAIAVLAQPVPLDWPGYLIDIVPLALVGAGFVFVAAAGCLLRVASLSTRSFGALASALGIAYLAWLVALMATILGAVGAPLLAVAQTAAMLATIGVGMALIRAHGGPIGVLLVVAAVAMLVPWTVTWLVVGVTWTAIGTVLLVERVARPGRGDLLGPASG